MTTHRSPAIFPVDIVPDSDAMAAADTAFRSPLDKPLNQLTEEDISQLTREDCRRYLKQKGMRRPSWNKSQAIEQVISLKNLLETKTDSRTGASASAGTRQEISFARPEKSPEVRTNINFTTPASVKVTRPDFKISGSADNTVPFRRKDPPKPAFSGDLSTRLPANSTAISPRTAGVTNRPVGQMTIFYGGKVNVYDGVPSDKARAILEFAARHNFPQDAPSSGTTAVKPLPYHLHATSATPAVISSSLQTAYREEVKMSREIDPDVEGPTSRKASVRRYLEKRKDRGRFMNNRKMEGSSSSRLQMYLNHQVRSQTPNEQSSQSGTCSPPQPRPPHTPTRCSSVENQTNNVNFSVDLNKKGKLQSHSLLPSSSYLEN
ncbi:hypothetical protein HHK36_022667 [Tetracentron sinense]|uniref:Protein TIFY n=1 Tax=Tetracentron sinense TaxID=13715 RepID=A0A834YSD7_TETSI|nr:hypothetical protein HHK36_022667 [Tetracentron sinense]